MRGLWLAALLMALPGAALAERVVAGLSEESISITTDFTGSEILIYGAVKRDAPPPEGASLEVVVTLQGPSAPVTVRRKSNVAGIWINTEAVDIGVAPTFYAVASTGPLSDILSPEDDRRFGVSIPQAIHAVGPTETPGEAQSFTDALLRLRQKDGRYIVDTHGVRLEQDTLFRADVALPANIAEGTYRARFFLLRDKVVVDHFEDNIQVRKVGLERWLFRLSRREPVIYGLLSLAIAAAAGWGASAAFRMMRS